MLAHHKISSSILSCFPKSSLLPIILLLAGERHQLLIFILFLHFRVTLDLVANWRKCSKIPHGLKFNNKYEDEEQQKPLDLLFVQSIVHENVKQQFDHRIILTVICFSAMFIYVREKQGRIGSPVTRLPWLCGYSSAFFLFLKDVFIQGSQDYPSVMVTLGTVSWLFFVVNALPGTSRSY